MGPALVTVFLFQFVSIWNNYLLPSLMLNSPSRLPVTVGLVQWRSEFANGVPPLLPITALLSRTNFMRRPRPAAGCHAGNS